MVKNGSLLEPLRNQVLGVRVPYDTPQKKAKPKFIY